MPLGELVQQRLLTRCLDTFTGPRAAISEAMSYRFVFKIPIVQTALRNIDCGCVTPKQVQVRL